MSSVVANIVCSKCSKSFPSTLFTRKSPPNTFFKTCNNCRTRRKERRESNRRLHRRTPCLPVPVSEPIESVDDNALTNASNTVVNLGSSSTHLNIITNNDCNETKNVAGSSSNRFCKGCKKYCELAVFVDRIPGKSFKRCRSCRQRDRKRRRPIVRLTDRAADNAYSRGFFANYKYCPLCKIDRPSKLFNDEHSPFLSETCMDCRASENYSSAYEQLLAEQERAFYNDDDDDYYNSDGNCSVEYADIGLFESDDEIKDSQIIPEECPTEPEGHYITAQFDSPEFRATLELHKQLYRKRRT